MHLAIRAPCNLAPIGNPVAPISLLKDQSIAPGLPLRVSGLCENLEDQVHEHEARIDSPREHVASARQ